MPDKWVIDADHPDGHLVPMTPEEEAQAALDRQAGQAEAAAEDTRHRNAETMRQELRDRMAQMLTIADALESATPPTAAQQRQALALCLRSVVRLARLQLQDLDEAAHP